MTYRLLLLLLLICTLHPASAGLLYCTEPTKPYCINAYGTFDDEITFDSCRSAMARYKSSVTDYMDCLKQSSDEAAEEFNKAVRQFNCKAQRESYCY